MTADYSMYWFLVWLTGGLALGLSLYGYLSTRDVFHPLVFLGPMLAFVYWGMPLAIQEQGGFWHLLPGTEMVWVQTYYLLGIACIGFGALSAGRPERKRLNPWLPAPGQRRQLRSAGVFLGAIGVAAFIYMVVRVGGLEVAYGRSYGGGWARSGYIREAFFWIIPGLTLLLMANIGRRVPATHWILIAAIAAPILIHGLLGARRGPTFLVFMTLFVGWYMVRFRRPSLLMISSAMGFVGILMILLVTNRSEIHLGGEFEYSGGNQIVSFVGRPTAGNEYILGSGLMIDAQRQGEYQWGARFLIGIGVRVIPRQVWPTQYEDAARFFGVRGFLVSDIANFSETLGWRNTDGAAVSLLPDVWKQFWWFSLLPLFGVGWLYGRVWRGAVEVGRLWLLSYVVLVSTSVFLVSQGPVAFLFRLLWLSAGGFAAWIVFVKIPKRRRQPTVMRSWGDLPSQRGSAEESAPGAGDLS